jgi:hypothetical protein
MLNGSLQSMRRPKKTLDDYEIVEGNNHTKDIGKGAFG